MIDLRSVRGITHAIYITIFEYLLLHMSVYIVNFHYVWIFRFLSIQIERASAVKVWAKDNWFRKAKATGADKKKVWEGVQSFVPSESKMYQRHSQQLQHKPSWLWACSPKINIDVSSPKSALIKYLLAHLIWMWINGQSVSSCLLHLHNCHDLAKRPLRHLLYLLFVFPCQSVYECHDWFLSTSVVFRIKYE